MSETTSVLDKQYLCACVAEVMGTFMLVFAGTAAIVVAQETGAIGHVGVAATFGLVVLSVIYAIGDRSGAHINPAVTLAFCAANRFPLKHVPGYILAQVTGALLASLCVKTLYPENSYLGSTVMSVTPTQGFFVELLLTWWLMYVILGVSEGAKEKGIVAGMVVGSVVGLEALFAGPMTGASMNPARSFGPAIVSGHLDQLLVYVFAPIIGAVLAVITCRVVNGKTCCEKGCIPTTQPII